jgi:lipoate-protein ligase A
VAEDHLVNVHVSGDFFLEPDDAIDVIVGALTGMEAATTPRAIAERIDAAIHQAEDEGHLMGPVTFIGFDSFAVAIATRRALGFATTWEDHTFEILRPPPVSVPHLAALDQVLLEAVAAGTRGPTLRFWEWDERAVVFGSFQSLSNEIDTEAAERLGVTLVRRISGGGAMFMEAGNCVTFSLVVPASLVDGMSFAESYRFLDSWVLGALATVGVTAQFSGLNDIASPAGKIAGSAQKRISALVGASAVGADAVVGSALGAGAEEEGLAGQITGQAAGQVPGQAAVLHHMTMAYDIDADAMMQVLRIGREKHSDKGIRSANKRVDPLRSQTGLPREAIVDAFEAHFRSRYQCVDSALTPAELDYAQRLVEEKFTAKAWLERIP